MPKGALMRFGLRGGAATGGAFPRRGVATDEAGVGQRTLQV